jgi:S1-C subfamily serine protease
LLPRQRSPLPRFEPLRPTKPAHFESTLSPSAQRAFETARDKLLQVRTLLRGEDSQASVGSGFIVDPEGLVITNYHVVSQIALQPQRYRLTYTRADGSSGTLQLLAFNAVRDLALTRMRPSGDSDTPARQGREDARTRNNDASAER